MVKLPEEFIQQTSLTMGKELFECYMQSFGEEPPVSIRLNPMKTAGGKWRVDGAERVPWCQTGYYLCHRPQFTFDPLFHCGCYYVQEAASMFIDEVFRQLSPRVTTALDLCAAPGGKSTLLRSLLPTDSVLYSNEPVRPRASVLAENVAKWGYANHYVTSSYPRDYKESRILFDLMLCDVPCSGEGMFRRDAATIGEWSLANVEKCARLQREIVSDAWQVLADGGIMIYSTCTFNTKENEENICWILRELPGAEVVPIHTEPEWNITGSLLEGFSEPVYRFIPGVTRSEGLFLCVLRKGGVDAACGAPKPSVRKARGVRRSPLYELTYASLADHDAPYVDLGYADAIRYLRGEALVLPPDTQRGVVTVGFCGQPLGTVKNIGSRANNQYPKEWRIKTTHLPNEYEAILIPA